MTRITLLPPLHIHGANAFAGDTQEMEITAVVHELKNQACTIGLGIAALKYPDETEDERQRHLAALEAVIGAMSRQFHRLDDWLLEASYQRKPGGIGGRGVGRADRKTARPYASARSRRNNS